MKINSILVGKGKGSAGNVTVTQLKGQTILKQKASIVANPNTEAQQMQRKMINRSVYFWQLFGNVLKSGWTSLLPFCSEYNTFVSVNSDFFKSKDFDKDSYRNIDAIGAQATKGRLGSLVVSVDDINNETQSFNLNAAQLQNIAKVGDKIKLLIGAKNQETMSYADVIVTPALFASTAPTVEFANPLEDASVPLVYAIWLESADGKESTSSVFQSFR